MTAGNRLVGVIGGMGPHATVDFMAKVIEKTPASSDQDHIRMLIEHNPRIPSRQSAMQGSGENPGPVLAEMAIRLESSGADFIVMPCNAAHAWRHDIIAATTIPLISIIDTSVSNALKNVSDDDPVGIFTTPACFAAGLYQRALSDENRDAVLQSPEELARGMSLIDQIKAGDQSDAVVTGLRDIANRLISKGAKAIIAACTELPLVLDQSMFRVPLISSTDALAEKTVALALRKEALPNE